MSPNTHRQRQRRRKTSQEERICSICSQSFKKAEHLAWHFRSHTKERPFTCHVCGKSYARQDTLLRHARVHHVNAAEPNTQNSDLGTSIGDTPFASLKYHPGPLSQLSAASGSAGSAPEHGQLPLDLQIHSTHIQPKLTPSLLGATAEILLTEDNQTTMEQDNILNAHLAATEMNNIIVEQTSPWAITSDVQRDLDWMAWITGPDFNLGALNQSLLESTEIGTKGHAPSPAEVGGLIQRRWHTFSETRVSSGQTTPDHRALGNNDRCQIHMTADESYRERLAESLQQRIQPGILPSTGFLDLCLQAYFKHFQPIFPLVHVPTFRPSNKNAILLLSICSIGSLFLGSSRAMAHGISMFERLQKAILASWETHISATGDSSIYPLQASLIGQTFGLLVGRPKDLMGIEVFHGSVVAWARNVKLFRTIDDPTSSTVHVQSDKDELQAAWKAWARMEEKKRIVMGIYIHDVELAKLHNHEPLIRHAIDKTPRLCPPSVFTASTVESWKRQLLMTQASVQIPPSPVDTDPLSRLAEMRPDNDFESYATLESIGALAQEGCDSAGTRPAIVENCERLLIQWYLQRFNHDTQNRPPSSQIKDTFCLLILWHSIFMHLYTRFDDLECACGREGEAVSQQTRVNAATWAKSKNAKRTILHASLIQKHFQSIVLGAEPAVHVPMALYYAGIAWASFTSFGRDEAREGGGGLENLDFPELKLLGVNQTKLFYEMTSGIHMGRPESVPFFRVIDLLGKINHWKLSRSLSTTLLAFVDNLPDLF